METSRWERLTEGETRSCSDGWGCVPSLLFDLRPNYGGGNEDNGTSFNRSHACTAALSDPGGAAGHLQSLPQPETPGK